MVMKVRKSHCMFEQSGIFKNEFIRLGVPAEDYDIRDNFGQTDHMVDLFMEIEKAYGGDASIFDKVGADDLIMAFFPCIYFEALQMTYFTNKNINLRVMDKKSRYDNIIDRAERRKEFYVLLYKLVAVCDMRGLRLIIENPATPPHYLLFATNFIPPTFIDRNRALRGDYYRKPTAYWFINCEPTCGHSYHPNTNVKTVMETKGSDRGGICNGERSMMSPEYARNFICDFILGIENENTLPELF